MRLLKHCARNRSYFLSERLGRLNMIDELKLNLNGLTDSLYGLSDPGDTVDKDI
jgi:hypothetical protein